MLPSVSAGSAALTKYAQAVSIAAPDAAPRDSDAAPRTEQEAARQNAEKQPVPIPQQDTLARDARATVDALLALLHSRVLAALAGLGTPDETARKAADAATAQLAAAFAAESRLAVEIVHALLERADDAASPDHLLRIVARGLTVLIDHQSGAVQVTPPRIDIAPVAGAPTASEPHHLVDFTDSDAEKVTPVLMALSAVQSAAAAAIAAADTVPRPLAAGSAGPAAAPVIVAPDAFVKPLTAPIAAALATVPDAPFANLSAPDAASIVSRALSQVVSTTLNNAAVSATAVPVGEVMAAVRHLQPVAGPPASGDAGADSRIVLASGRVSVAFDPGNGAITVQVGDRVTAYAPASIAANGAPLPGLDAASLPDQRISSRLPVGIVVDRPSGVPFIPPEFDPPDAPAKPGAPTAPATPPADRKPGQNAAAAAATLAAEQALRHLDHAAMRNATVLRGVGAAAGAELPALARIALDISAEIAPGAPVAVNPPVIGKFGLPKPAPAQTEPGPVMKHGYADASANQVPVLPAVHLQGHLPPENRRKMAKKQQKRLPAGKYETVALDDAFTRDMPPGHQGLVFSSVVFSV